MRVQKRRWRLIAAAIPLFAAALCATPPRAAAADGADLSGNWKFVMFTIGETDLLLLDVKQDDGKLSATVNDTLPQLRGSKVNQIESKGDKVKIEMMLGGMDTVFNGKAAKDGKFLGTFRIQGQTIPAQLQKTEDKKLAAAPDTRDFFQQFAAAQNEPDPKERSKKFAAMTKKETGSPKLSLVYAQLLKDAGAAGMTEDQARTIYEEWVNGAKLYGDDYAESVRAQALQSLAGQKELAGLTLELATAADKALGPDASVETRVEVVKSLASAAKLAGKTELAEKALARAEKLEGELDEDYHKKVPPFKPEISEGRKDKKTDRVVLLELFTGAQCPPCVAADVAFDALIQTYKPSELITLQYHLHIPGPDPLANPDTIARAGYYPKLRGTPSTFFNGESLAGGGGGMGNAKGKYDQYRQIIDKDLDGEKNATIDLQVNRSGDEVKIVASAQAKSGKAKAKANGDAKDKEKDNCDPADKPQVRLRLALIEEQVRYVGGNKLRFHHHVVRALPGGAEGKALTDGQGKTEVTVKLSDLKQGLETYLSDFAKQGGGFANPLPALKLDDLSVVAFVQDDSDQTVLHAVLAPIGAAK